MNLKWNAYHYNTNGKRLEKFNIFDHWKFKEEVTKHLNEEKDKEEFKKKVKTELAYYFWSKCEWEVLLKDESEKVIMEPWIGRTKNPIKLDVTDDEDFDWVGFYKKCREKFIGSEYIKIDVYEQIMFNFDEFVDYIWDVKKE